MIKDRGFTLIEVVVAMAILGIALTTVISLFGQSLRTVSLVSRYSEMMTLAGEKMDEVVCCPDNERDESEEGLAGAARWTRIISPLNLDDTAAQDMFKVQVHVTWPDGGREREITLESFLYERPG